MQGKWTEQKIFSYIGEVKDNLITYLMQHYENELIPDELVLNEAFEDLQISSILNAKISIPKRGDKKKLYDLAYKNAKEDLEKYHMLYRVKEEALQKTLTELSDIFSNPINTIEIFDNAQLFGVAPVSAMVVYKDLKFEKRLYRKYHIKTAIQDDYQSFREVLYRRYQRLLLENKPMPDLILLDGGIGQLNVGIQVIKSLGLNIPIGSLKKNEKHQLQSLLTPEEEIILDKKSQLYRLLLSFSEEVHRFAISFHRKTKAKKEQVSLFDQIPGLGAQRKKKLLQSFYSIDEIKKATAEEIHAIGIPMEVAKKIKEVLE